MFYINTMKEIPIRNSDVKAYVDDEDFDELIKSKWYLSHGYAVTARHRKGASRTDKNRTVNFCMHRLIMGHPPTEKLIVDHIDRNRLNNQRSNLRWVSHHQNAQNSAPYSKYGFKGVAPTDSKWIAQVQGKFLGSYDSVEEAAMAYDKAARYFYGENYAYLNFPDKTYDKPVRYVDFEPEIKKRKSKYVGVSLHTASKRRKKWRAIFRKKIVGYFLTEDEAGAAYLEAKKIYEGS